MNYDDTNRGALFKNTRKETENHADYTGTINVDGVEYYISAWIRERKDGSGKYLSLSVKPKHNASKVAQNAARNQSGRQKPLPEDDDVPF